MEKNFSLKSSIFLISMNEKNFSEPGYDREFLPWFKRLPWLSETLRDYKILKKFQFISKDLKDLEDFQEFYNIWEIQRVSKEIKRFYKIPGNLSRFLGK